MNVNVIPELKSLFLYRFPRLVSLIIKFLGDAPDNDEKATNEDDTNRFREGPISAWYGIVL